MAALPLDQAVVARVVCLLLFVLTRAYATSPHCFSSTAAKPIKSAASHRSRGFLQGGRRARLNHALFHHNPRGCYREMFNMNKHICDEHRVSCLMCLLWFFFFLIVKFIIYQMEFKSDYYDIIYPMFKLYGEMSLCKVIQPKENALNLFYEAPLKENLWAVWWLSSIHSASFSEPTLCLFAL